MELYWDGQLWTDDARPQAGAPPNSGPVLGAKPGGGWDWRWLFFSFKGRAHRAHYWTVAGVSFALLVIAAIPLIASTDVTDDASEVSGGLIILFFAFWALGVWAQLAVGVKRWHDRDKSGVWMFIGLIPYIGWLWVLVECGFLPGTDGANKYGGDPRRSSISPG